MAFCQAPRMRALGVPRAHVLHARAPSRRVPLPPPRARSGHPPRTASTPNPSLAAEPPWPPPGALQRRRQVGHGSKRAAAAAPAMDGAAHVRQLPSGAVRAYPRTRPLAPVATTYPPCYNRTVVRRRSYPRPRNRPSCTINGGPELIQTPRQPQAISLEPPSPQ